MKKPKNINELMKKYNISKYNISGDLNDLVSNVKFLKDEHFIQLQTSIYPNICNYYLISNKGRIYSTKSNKLVTARINGKNKSGYYVVNLQSKISNSDRCISDTFSIHRLMMCVFNPIDNMENLVINHKDGNKLNNDLDNLEWCTTRENTIHAYKNNLIDYRYGDECINSSVSKKMVEKICKLYMTDKYTKQEIADIVGCSKSVVVNITNNASWKHITKKYNFDKKETFRAPKIFSKEEIHNLCKYYQNIKKPENLSNRRHVINAIKYVTHKKRSEINSSMIYSALGIYNHKYYKKISSQYKF